MTSSTPLGASLETLDERYRAVLVLTDSARTLSQDVSGCASLAARFRSTGYVQVSHAVDQQALVGLCAALWPILAPLAFPVFVPHEPDRGNLSSGGRLRRVDPRSLDPDGQGATLTEVLRGIGLTEFGRLFAELFDPLLTAITGGLDYERVFVNLYEEGDYLTAHDDAHMGERFDVNLSATMDGVCGLRVLSGGSLVTHYDDGSISILGPRVWHEVPPLLRVPGWPPPRRMTITLRYLAR
jgi:hypothetical protein